MSLSRGLPFLSQGFHLLRRECGDVLVSKHNLPRIGFGQPQDQSPNRCLPATVLAYDPQGLSLTDFQVHPISSFSSSMTSAELNGHPQRDDVRHAFQE